MLKDIKHVSFDAWNTLLIPNKQFADLRSEELASVMGVDGDDNIGKQIARQRYTSVKRTLDRLAELKGLSFDVDTNWSLLEAQFGDALSEDALVELRYRVEDLFLEHPPEIPELLVAMIQELKSQGYTINVLSNTNFIGGHVLEKLFGTTFGKRAFDFTMYSDQYGLAKPSQLWYERMVENARVLHTKLYTNEILHIGDNEVTDYQGALNAGIKALKVDTPNHLATLLQEALQ